MLVKQCHKPPIWEWFIPPIYVWFGGSFAIVLTTLISFYSSLKYYRKDMFMVQHQFSKLFFMIYIKQLTGPVRKGGALWKKSGRRNCPWPCLGHPVPSVGTGKVNLHAHSPNIAHACVHSRGVRARHPSSGVRSSPPSNASVGDPGTAEADRSSDRLLHSKVHHSAGDLWLVGVANRLDLWTRGSPPSSTAVAPVVPWAACFDGGLEWVSQLGKSALCPMSTSDAKTCAWPVTMTRPALSSAWDSVMSKTAGLC